MWCDGELPSCSGDIVNLGEKSMTKSSLSGCSAYSATVFAYTEAGAGAYSYIRAYTAVEGNGQS